VPDHPLPSIRYRVDLQEKAAELFRQIKERSAELSRTPPTNYEFLPHLHRK
jgi:hypothetical protein